MKFICAQPAIDYYTWQVEVMINNFIKNGVNPNNIEIVCSHSGVIPEKWRKLADHYNTVRFFFYKDERYKQGYIPSIRPHVLHKHWLHHPELEHETVFYHDSDIIFAKPVDFKDMLDDNVCYVSDTVSYIGAKYIQSKGEHYLDLMTEIVGVNKSKVIAEEKNSGGAQYLLKNIPTKFWEKMYYDCETLYRMVNNQIRKDPPHHEIQIWCADMWALLWNLWLYDREVKVSPELSFSWATSGASDWDKHLIYHNAGVTVDRKNELFFKGEYINKSPYDITIDGYSNKYCAYNYAKEVIETAKITCLK